MRARHPVLDSATIFLTLAACLLPWGCASSERGGAEEGAPGGQPYSGPGVAIDSSGPRHLVVLTAPTPGWSFTFDRVGASGADVYLTVTSPDPALLYPTVIVEQKIDSTVDSSKPIRVFVRLAEFGRDPAGREYRLAGGAG